MCECKNTLWTFILTPTGILPKTECPQRLHNHYGNLNGYNFDNFVPTQMNGYRMSFCNHSNSETDAETETDSRRFRNQIYPEITLNLRPCAIDS